MTTSTTPQANLRTIADRWTDLRELLQTRTPQTWPPAGRLADHQADLDQDDPDATELLHQQAAVERAERTALAPGTRPAPLRVGVLDALVEMEAELLELADQIASAVQRAPFTLHAASPFDERARDIALATAAMAERDRTDARRWRFNLGPRTAEHAAAWLADRLDGPAGPHRALTYAEGRQVAYVARAVRQRLDRALGETERRAVTNFPCGCGGQLDIVAGAGGEDRLECQQCGATATIAGMIDQITAA
ncbi:hypothetical protein [Kitasatospora sp. NPDC004289]